MNFLEHFKVKFWNFLKIKSALTHSFTRIFVRNLKCQLRGGRFTRGIRQFRAITTGSKVRFRDSEKTPFFYLGDFCANFFFDLKYT